MTMLDDGKSCGARVSPAHRPSAGSRRKSTLRAKNVFARAPPPGPPLFPGKIRAFPRFAGKRTFLPRFSFPRGKSADFRDVARKTRLSLGALSETKSNDPFLGAEGTPVPGPYLRNESGKMCGINNSAALRAETFFLSPKERRLFRENLYRASASLVSGRKGARATRVGRLERRARFWGRRRGRARCCFRNVFICDYKRD